MAKIETFNDLFKATSLNGSKWSPYTGGGATFGYSTAGAQVNYPASSTSSTDGDLTSNSTYDFTNSYIYIHWSAVPSSSTHADAGFGVQLTDYTNQVNWTYEAGTLYAQYWVSGAITNVASIAWNSTTTQWLRIREGTGAGAGGSSGTVYWDYSTDGVTWTNLTSHADPITLTTVSAIISGTCYQNETSPGTFEFDSFNTQAVLKSYGQEGISRIQMTVTKTQTAKARIAQNYTKTQSAKANLFQSKINYQYGKSRIQNNLHTTITGLSRIVEQVTKTQTAKATVFQQKTKTQTAVARIQSTPFHIDKRYIYKSFSQGAYIGNLPGVTSPFTFSHEINTAGATTEITAAITPDTAILASSFYTDESGNLYTDESGNVLVSEGALTPFTQGGSLLNALFKNGNTIEVWEVSYYHPSGIRVFIGQVQRVEANYGSGSNSDTIKMLVYSDGQDLSNYVIRANPYTYTADQTQLVTASNFQIYYQPTPTNTWLQAGQTFKTGSGVTNVGAISLKLSSSGSYAGGAGAVPVTLNLYDGVAMTNLLGSVTQSVNVSSDTIVQFSFPFSIYVSASTTYFFTVSVPQGYYISIDQDSGTPYANGSEYTNTYNGSTSTGMVITTGYSLYFETYSGTGSTVGTFSSLDPSTGILVAIMQDYQARGGKIQYSTGGSGTILATGLSINYQFNTNSTYEGIQNMQIASTSGFYYYVDLGSDYLYFQPTHTSADIVLTKGRHFTELNLVFSIENIKNSVYFIGGIPTGNTTNIYVYEQDATSVSLYGPKLDRLSDTNVLDLTTARLFANQDVSANKAEQNQTTVKVLAQTMDLTTLKPGLVIGFNGFGTFVDQLLLQIVRIDYTPEYATLTLGIMPKRMSLTLQQITKGLLAQETIANPTSPS